MKIGLFGFGVVGHGLYNVLKETHGIKAEIERICVKDPDKPRTLPPDRFTYSAADILDDPSIDTVVELINDADAAFEIVRTALENGKAVVTANKRMIAEHLEEIYSLQRKHNLPVLYEGAVCASIPIIRNLEEYYDNDLIASVEGIFNGSTNYILTKVFEENLPYPEALHLAQELGFAESDPSLDVQGFDPKFKLAIMIAHAFGIFVKPEQIVNIGIEKISEDDFRHARAAGYTIKLIARAQKVGQTIIGQVTPQFVEQEHLLSNIRNEYNAVLVEGAFSEKQLFVGKGAGSYPTGSAVLSDISALTYGYRYEYKKLQQERDLQFLPFHEASAYISFPEKLGSEIAPRGWQAGKALHQPFVEGIFNLAQLQKWSKKEGVSVILNQPDEDRFDQRKPTQELDLKIA